MSWNHPDDVPISLTRRAYCLRGVKISQNDYAAVVADAYADVKAEIVQGLIGTADAATRVSTDGPAPTPATLATAEILGLPWEAVDAVFRVFTQEAARLARERREQRLKNRERPPRARESNAETLERPDNE